MLSRLRSAHAAVGCVDLYWAASVGLLEPVEVRWLNGQGLHCPDATVSREAVSSDQYVVMAALAAKHQLTCADVEWNAANGYLTRSGLVNLEGLVGGCVHSQYALMVSLLASGVLNCDDVVWNLGAGRISQVQASWLQAPLGCALPLG
jgi:hypothetical protein